MDYLKYEADCIIDDLKKSIGDLENLILENFSGRKSQVSKLQSAKDLLVRSRKILKFM